MARNNNVLHINEDAVINAFKRLSGKEQTKINKAGLRAGAKMIQKDVRSEVNSYFRNKDEKFGDMLSGVSVTVGKKGDYSKVNLFGKRKYHHSYILRFFSIGTKIRKQRKYKGRSLRRERNLGRISQHDFFQSVNQSTVSSRVDKYITKNTMKLFNNRN